MRWGGRDPRAMRERDVPLRAVVVERECSEHFLKTCARVARAARRGTRTTGAGDQKMGGRRVGVTSGVGREPRVRA